MSNFVDRNSVFKGMTLDQMKTAYSKMTSKERGQFAGAFVRAAKELKKPAKGSAGQRSTTTKSTKPAPVQPATSNKPAPVQPTNSKVQKAVSEFAKRNYQKGKMYGEDVKPGVNKGKFASRDMAKGKMYGKPKRSDYPSGRTGTAKYLAALRKYNKAKAPSTPKKEYDRRGRRKQQRLY